MILGIGVDLVDIARFESKLADTPNLAARLFADVELADAAGSAQKLAGKFAAKEAFVKAVGNPVGMNWHDVRVAKDALGKPSIVVSGEVARITAAAGIDRFHLSITHDGGMACAFVVAEGSDGGTA